MERNISDTLPLLRVDPFQMAQVFQNLILNACQAMSKGGELRIAARKITGGEHALPNVDFIEISVSDTGEGISPENMKVLFHPLFTTKAKGIGLGLVVSKRLTETNGGRIDVESRLGEGTTFTVILPCEGGSHNGRKNKGSCSGRRSKDGQDDLRHPEGKGVCSCGSIFRGGGG